MRTAPAAMLDSLEDLAEHLRVEIGVCTLSISAYDRATDELGTLVNAGALGPGEERRPAAERYPLRWFPAAAALVRTRRPYVVSPADPGAAPSHALAAALRKTSQAAAPVVVDGNVWGELWVGSTDEGLPLTRAELALIGWTAERAARILPDIFESELHHALDAAAAPRLRSYDLWFDGRLDPRRIRLPGTSRARDGFTVATVTLDRRELVSVLLRLHARKLCVAAAIATEEASSGMQPVPARSDAPRQVYELQVAGCTDELALELHWNCSLARADGITFISAVLDGTELADVLRAIAHLELLSLRRLG